MEIRHDYSCSKEQAYKIVDGILNKLQDQYGDMIKNPSKCGMIQMTE